MYTDPRWNKPWAKRLRKQITRVVSVSGREITTDFPIRLAYEAKWNPEVRVIKLIENVGVEDLFICRQDDEHNQIIYFHRAVNCWAKGCELYKCKYAHVFAAYTRFLTIEGCYMQPTAMAGTARATVPFFRTPPTVLSQTTSSSTCAIR